MRDITVFTSNDCAPCQVLKPKIKSFARRHQFNLLFVDTKTHRDEAIKFEIMSVPTTIFRINKKVKKVVGLLSRSEMRDVEKELSTNN